MDVDREYDQVSGFREFPGKPDDLRLDGLSRLAACQRAVIRYEIIRIIDIDQCSHDLHPLYRIFHAGYTRPLSRSLTDRP